MTTTPTLPAVGDGGTVSGWSDRHAVTVIKVSPTGYRVTVQYDKATRIDSNGMSDAQSYEFERDPEGRVETFIRQPNGRYKHGTTRLSLGHRSAFFDYSF